MSLFSFFLLVSICLKKETRRLKILAACVRHCRRVRGCAWNRRRLTVNINRWSRSGSLHRETLRLCDAPPPLNPPPSLDGDEAPDAGVFSVGFHLNHGRLAQIDFSWSRLHGLFFFFLESWPSGGYFSKWNMSIWMVSSWKKNSNTVHVMWNVAVCGLGASVELLQANTDLQKSCFKLGQRILVKVALWISGKIRLHSVLIHLFIHSEMVSLPPTISALNFFILHISEAALYTTFNTFSLLFTAYCAPLPPAGSIGSDYFPGFPTALFCCDFTPMISRLGADKSPSFQANLLFKPHQHVFFFQGWISFYRKGDCS